MAEAEWEQPPSPLQVEMPSGRAGPIEDQGCFWWWKDGRSRSCFEDTQPWVALRGKRHPPTPEWRGCLGPEPALFAGFEVGGFAP